MFKKAALFFTILLSAISAQAYNWSIGLKGGESVHGFYTPNESGTSDYDSTSDIAPSATIFMETTNNKFIGQQIGVGYFQAGGQLVHLQYGTHLSHWPVQTLVKLDYLFMSYGLKGNIHIRNIIPYILIGAQFDYLIKSKYDVFYPSINPPYTQTTPYSALNKFNITPIIGFGIGYQINKFEIIAEYQPYYHLLPFNGAKDLTSGHIWNIGLIMLL